MCRYCVEFGNGTKWYLNPENYRKELFSRPGHDNGFTMLTGPGKNTFEIAGLADVEDAIDDYSFGGPPIGVAQQKVKQHTGQIVPLEDALRIIDLSGDKFLLMHCACRRYFGRGDVYSCLFFEPCIENALEKRPWETDSKVIDKAEAKRLEIEFDKKGLFHLVMDSGVERDGRPPIVLCHCHTTDCTAIEFNTQFTEQGNPGIVSKGEYVAKINREKCAEGCAEYPLCAGICPFGAMRYNPFDQIASVAIEKCYGCGVCRRVCPTKAIRLVDREEYPALVDVW